MLYNNFQGIARFYKYRNLTKTNFLNQRCRPRHQPQSEIIIKNNYWLKERNKPEIRHRPNFADLLGIIKKDRNNKKCIFSDEKANSNNNNNNRKDFSLLLFGGNVHQEKIIFQKILKKNKLKEHLLFCFTLRP
jgi:hypothetical protein